MKTNIFWSFFCFIPNIGNSSLKKIINRFKTPRDALNATHTELLKAGLSRKAAENIKEYKQKINFQKILETLANENISLITFLDPLYPEKLLNTYNSPAILFYKGNLNLLNEKKLIGVVGTRNSSSEGLHLSKKISFVLGENNHVIVSGLALGIDTQAHLGCLESKGKTIAVLGSSLSKKEIYPKQNLNLSEKIIQNKGLLISEFPPLLPSSKFNFAKRNRIIAGLSESCIIIEAPMKSGAMITAKHAIEENRNLYTFPGSIFHKNYQGNNFLIKQGATPLLSIEELKEYFEVNKVEKNIFNNEEKQVLQILSQNQRCLLEQIAHSSNIPLTRLIKIITSLESKGAIVQSGGYYQLLTNL